MGEKKAKEITHYSLKAAAEILGISEMSLRRKVYNNEITYYQPSERGHFIFLPEHLEEFQNRRTFKAQAA